jgi:hypothetical protein
METYINNIKRLSLPPEEGDKPIRQMGDIKSDRQRPGAQFLGKCRANLDLTYKGCLHANDTPMST